VPSSSYTVVVALIVRLHTRIIVTSQDRNIRLDSNVGKDKENNTAFGYNLDEGFTHYNSNANAWTAAACVQEHTEYM
jgi:hypothetical protein